MERDSVEKVKFVCLVIATMLLCPYILRATETNNLPPDAVEVSGEGIYYLEGKDNLEGARLMAVEIAKSNAIASAFGTAVNSSNYSQAYESTAGDYFNSFYSLMSSIQTGIWIKDLEVPEVTSFMDGESSFGFKARVRGIVRPLTSIPIETKGRLLVSKGTDRDHNYETSVLKRGDEFYFGFKAAANGFLAVYVVDEDDMVCKAAPIGKDDASLKWIKAEKETILWDNYLKNIAELSHPESREAYNRIVFVFSPNEFTLPLSEDADPSTGMPMIMDFEKFYTWLQDMAVADPRFTVTWQTIIIKR
ncbi:MAG: hypothetical protein K2N35_12810 [Muribaculaceae bacterium]|nr:hypothetical protein [Muribaculaceae bacterium]